MNRPVTLVIGFLFIINFALAYSFSLKPSSCARKTTSGECCVFPFIYRGELYDTCTNDNHDRPWCSTTTNYDANKQWGNCEVSVKPCDRMTTTGKCCVLPFTYRGELYDTCINENHNRPWCSTTSNYGADKQWGNCQVSVKLCARKTTSGECCVFPFTYRGDIYERCTNDNHNRPWCSTTANYDADKQWGDCEVSAKPCAKKTTTGECCVLPFTYRGDLYTTCTNKNHNRPWCSTTSDYDADMEWGNC